MVSTKIQQIRDNYQAKKAVNPLAVTPVTQPVATPVVSPVVKPVSNIKQNFGMGSAEGGPVNSTVATSSNPIVKINTPKTTVDYSTLDKGGLQDEIARMTFRMKTGKVTEEDAVNYNKLTRMLGEQNMNQASTLDTSEIDRLRAEQEKVKMDRMSQDEQALAAFKQQQQAQTARRIADVTAGGVAQRDAAQTATSFSGFGRSTVNAEQQASIEKQTQQAIQYENAAADLAVQKYQAELQGASADVIDSYNKQIAQAQGQASSIMQNAQAEASKINASQSQLFGKTIEELVANSGMKLDVNDEAALSQFINIARNPDGSVNESVVGSLPENYQAIVRAGVQNGIGKKEVVQTAPKIERIGGTNKNPTYGYRDGSKFVTTNAQGVATVRRGGGGSGGGGAGGGGASTGGGVVGVTGLDMSGVDSKDKKLVGLMNDYKDVLSSTTYLGLQTDPYKKGQLQNLESQIAAEYKKAEKLGSLDAGVERLVKGLLGKSGTFSANTYNNQAQAATIEGYIISKGGKISTPSSPVVNTTKTSTTAPSTATPKFVGNAGKNRLKK